uniref:Uncharacterized protein n=1 Tax=Marseillevirus LCMAC102 TaxID=2506603 RepID=A0A481YUM3_9VIRU|nr:MAG: uncharacterized protein LCMAC102_04330 [Marseillevirus LCMAC102]
MDTSKEGREKNQTQVIKTIVGLSDRILRRQQSFQDPVVRFSLLIDKLCLILDVGVAIVEVYADDMEPKLQEKIKSSSRNLSKELDDMFEWLKHKEESKSSED